MNKFKIKDNVTQIIHLKRQIKKVFNTICQIMFFDILNRTIIYISLNLWHEILLNKLSKKILLRK
jgi:hypothetical protein